MFDLRTVDLRTTAVADLVPHKETMLLLDVVNWISDDAVEAETVVRDDGLFDDGVASNGQSHVPAWLGMEYMAQTIAAYAGAQGQRAGHAVKIGFLLGTRSFRSNVDQLPCGTQLRISAQKLLQDDNGMAAFQCKVTGTHPQTQTAIEQEAILNVFQPENPATILAGA